MPNTHRVAPKMKKGKTSPCPGCGSPTKRGWKGAGVKGYLVMVVRTCHCKVRELSVVNVDTGELVARFTTELSPEEAERFSMLPPISDDEVISFHHDLFP